MKLTVNTNNDGHSNLQIAANLKMFREALWNVTNQLRNSSHADMIFKLCCYYFSSCSNIFSDTYKSLHFSCNILKEESNQIIAARSVTTSSKYLFRIFCFNWNTSTNILYAHSLEVDSQRPRNTGYFILKVEMKSYNVMIAIPK